VRGPQLIEGGEHQNPAQANLGRGTLWPNLRETSFPRFHQNLIKPLRQRFLDYVIDSAGEINVANVALLPFAA
jgi:hypothetical protein